MKTRVPAPANDRVDHPARALARLIFKAKMRDLDSPQPETPHGPLRHLRQILD
jgi:hypothetical protein